MSYVSSLPPDKPSECSTGAWQELNEIIASSEELAVNYIIPNVQSGEMNAVENSKVVSNIFPEIHNDVVEVPRVLDIQNMEVCFVEESNVTITPNVFPELRPVPDVVIEILQDPHVHLDDLGTERSQCQLLTLPDKHLVMVGSPVGSTDQILVEEQNTGSSNEMSSEISTFRKKKRAPETWKQNVRKAKRQRGEEYRDAKGKVHQKREIKTKSCISNDCNLSCTKKITSVERRIIHEQFWKLSDDEKFHFYSKHVERMPAKRKRTNKEVSKKTFSYKYHFQIHSLRLQVCQSYFLNTLDISKQRIYYFFNKVQDQKTNIPRKSIRGLHTKKVISEERKRSVRLHIESFKPMESHYCRAGTKKTYLDRDLNLTRMYQLYVSSTEDPVRFNIYSHIFNYEYNISFFKPKKDLCDKCEEYKYIKNPTEAQQISQKDHIRRKDIGNAERQADRSRCKGKQDNKTCVLTYDLQNTFALPKAYVGHYYYKQKLNCFNLTAHSSIDKTIYNALWHDFICGRARNHLANAIIKILKAVVADHPYLTKIILWSDSCVPQNRNSILSYALQHFLNSAESGNIQELEHKYSEPGHGNLQEIDSAHSCIERYIRNMEIWSPLTLIRILMKIPNSWKYKLRILQMQPTDYLDYGGASAKLNYAVLPYSKVKNIIYEKHNLMNLKYRLTFDGDVTEVKILNKGARTRLHKEVFDWNEVETLKDVNLGITEEKKKAITEMLPQMPEEERHFYHVMLSKTKPSANSLSKQSKLSHKVPAEPSSTSTTQTAAGTHQALASASSSRFSTRILSKSKKKLIK